MAFQAVRIQQSVVEFILNHTEHIFSADSALIKPKEGRGKKNSKNVMSQSFKLKPQLLLLLRGRRSDVFGEIRHASHQWPVRTDETDEPGGGPGPLPEPQPPRAQRAPAGEQPSGHQHGHALPHRH